MWRENDRNREMLRLLKLPQVFEYPTLALSKVKGRIWMEDFNQLNISQVSRASYPKVNGIHFYSDAYIPLHLCNIIIFNHVATKSK